MSEDWKPAVGETVAVLADVVDVLHGAIEVEIPGIGGPVYFRYPTGTSHLSDWTSRELRAAFEELLQMAQNVDDARVRGTLQSAHTRGLLTALARVRAAKEDE